MVEAGCSVHLSSPLFMLLQDEVDRQAISLKWSRLATVPGSPGLLGCQAANPEWKRWHAPVERTAPPPSFLRRLLSRRGLLLSLAALGQVLLTAIAALVWTPVPQPRHTGSVSLRPPTVAGGDGGAVPQLAGLLNGPALSSVSKHFTVAFSCARKVLDYNRSARLRNCGGNSA